MNKLYKSETQKMISGVCGGLAEYMDIDVTIIRLLWVGITLFSGVGMGIIVYIIASIVIPHDTDGADDADYTEL